MNVKHLLQICDDATDIDIVSAGARESEALSQFQDLFDPPTVGEMLRLLEWYRGGAKAPVHGRYDALLERLGGNDA